VPERVPAGPFDPREIILALARARVEFILVGGVAVQAHGYVRATQDLDVVPKPDLLNLSRLAEALAELEASPLHTSAAIDVTDPQLLRRVPMIPLVTRFGRLDLLNAKHTAGSPGSYEALRKGAVTATVGGEEVLVAGLDHLVRMKRATGRSQDLDDIGALTRDDQQLEREAPEST
jgi:hypothetical protein